MATPLAPHTQHPSSLKAPQKGALSQRPRLLQMTRQTSREANTVCVQWSTNCLQLVHVAVSSKSPPPSLCKSPCRRVCTTTQAHSLQPFTGPSQFGHGSPFFSTHAPPQGLDGDSTTFLHRLTDHVGLTSNWRAGLEEGRRHTYTPARSIM